MLNAVQLEGRLTADPELNHTNSDIAVASFNLAVDRSFIKAGEERQADFIRIVCWRSTAEFAAKYFRKGQLVIVQGSIQTNSYTDKDGIKRKSFEVVATNLHFAESKKNGDGSTSTANQKSASAGSDNNSVPHDNDDFVIIDGDDDLPF